MSTMKWTNVSGHRWERPADGIESYFIATGNMSGGFFDGREHYTLYSRLKLDLELPGRNKEAALRQAWKQMRHEQPSLATRVEGWRKVYDVPESDEALERWLAETFVVAAEASDAESLYHALPAVKVATMYWVPKTSELVFRCPHHNIDGTGVLMFWDAFLGALVVRPKGDADLRFGGGGDGDETARLAPAMEDILGFPEDLDPEKAEQAKGIFMDWVKDLPGIGPPSKVAKAPAGVSRNAERVLPAATTASIIAACKARGVTVTSAVHAAYVRTVLRRADPATKQTQYVTANSFNLRPLLPAPYDSPRYAVSCYYAPLGYKLDEPQRYSFAELAARLGDFYAGGFRANPALLELKGSFTRVMAAVVQTPEFLANPVSQDALISSLGIVERHTKREYRGEGGAVAKVRDLKVSVDVVLGMSMLFVYTFDDKLRLVYAFNDGYEDPKDIETYLDDVQEILIEELLS